MTADTLKLIDSILEWWADSELNQPGKDGSIPEPDFVTQAKKLLEKFNPNDLPL